MDKVTVVFDMGATHTRVAVSADGLSISEPIIFDTNPTFEAGIKTLGDNIEAIINNQPIHQIIGGIPSVLDRLKQKITYSNNLPQWVGQPLGQTLSNRFKASARLFNDAELIALGEATMGAGQHKSIVGYITVSTGVGGVRIIDGLIDRHFLGFEIGFQYIGSNPSGQLTTLEQAVGGNALEKRFNISPAELAKQPDPWDEVIHNLAIGVHNAIIFWSPEVIVFGGGMMRDIPLERLRGEVASLLKVFPDPPEFCLAELGDKGGLLGALALSRIE